MKVDQMWTVVGGVGAAAVMGPMATIELRARAANDAARPSGSASIRRRKVDGEVKTTTSNPTRRTASATASASGASTVR